MKNIMLDILVKIVRENMSIRRFVKLEKLSMYTKNVLSALSLEAFIVEFW